MRKLIAIALLVLSGVSLAAAPVIGIQQAQASRENDREWQTGLHEAPTLAPTSRLEIIPLYKAASATEYGLPVVGVVGGLHYLNTEAEDVAAPIQFLGSRQPQLVALSSHDSGLRVLAAFGSAFPANYHTLRVDRSMQFPR